MKIISPIILIMMLLCNSKNSFPQTYVNQGNYWPPNAPNGTPRITADSTSEDWWYDVKTVPLSHPAYGPGRYIASGYSGFDDIGLGNLYNNDPCNHFTEINFIDPAFSPEDFDLPDMRHLNFTGTIGLINLTRTSLQQNQYVWIYNYGLGATFTKVIPTSDGGFIATGFTNAFNIPYPSSEIQFKNFQSLTNAPQPILYQSPPVVQGNPNEIHPFSFAVCPPIYNVPPEYPTILSKRHACVIKVDKDGILLWYYTYGIVPFTDGGNPAYKNSSWGTDIVETQDGYFVCGLLQNSPVFIDLGNHGFILKIDKLGIMKWINQYHDVNFLTEKFTALSLKNSNELYVTGERTTTNSGAASVCVPYPLGCPCVNGSGDANLEHYKYMKFIPFLKKIDPNSGAVIWDLPLGTNPSLDYRVRNLALDINNNLLVPVSSNCNTSYANGECRNSYVYKVADNISSASIIQTTAFGVIRAYDMSTSLGVKATTDGGFIVVGTKKAYDFSLNRNYALPPYGNGYDMTNTDQQFLQSDAYVAKCNGNGGIEWTTIFDSHSLSPGGSMSTMLGNPRDQQNLDRWMNYTNTRSKLDIKREECLYSITTSVNGEIIIGGNMSSNIDDSYIAMIDNNCDLDLSNHLIQAIPALDYLGGTPAMVTNMDNFVATNINTGRKPGNLDEIALFDVNQSAVINMEAGLDITMNEGTDLEYGTDVNSFINPAHTCTPGALYSNFNNSIQPSYLYGDMLKNLKQLENVNYPIVLPNPTSGIVTINHPSKIKELEIFDQYGKAIIKINNNGSTQTKVNLTNFAAGVYVLRLSSLNHSVKIVKIK